jgi:hypothetical protein
LNAYISIGIFQHLLEISVRQFQRGKGYLDNPEKLTTRRGNIKMMFGSSLLPVVCRKVYLRYLCLIAHNDGPTQIVLCFCFCLVFPRLVVSFSGLSRYPLPLWNCLTLISRRCWNIPIDIYALVHHYVQSNTNNVNKLFYKQLAVKTNQTSFWCGNHNGHHNT